MPSYFRTHCRLPLDRSGVSTLLTSALQETGKINAYKQRGRNKEAEKRRQRDREAEREKQRDRKTAGGWTHVVLMALGLMFRTHYTFQS